MSPAAAPRYVAALLGEYLTCQMRPRGSPLSPERAVLLHYHPAPRGKGVLVIHTGNPPVVWLPKQHRFSES